MNFPIIFPSYIIKNFIINLIIVACIIISILMISSIIEILRIFHGKSGSFVVYISLVLLKIPSLIEKINPFIFFIAGIVTFTKLTKSNELIIARAAGISVWQWISPLIITIFIIGVFFVTIFNSFASMSLNKYDQSIDKYTKTSDYLLNVISGKTWLRQKNESNNIIVNAEFFDSENQILKKATLFIYNHENKFIERLDADRIYMKKDHWVLDDILKFTHEANSIHIDKLILKTTINIDNEHNNFTNPETISLWDSIKFRQNLQNSGFSILKCNVHFYRLIMLPFYLCLMVMISAIFSLKPFYIGRTNISIIIGFAANYLIYFTLNILAALASNGKLSPMISIFVPYIIIFLISLSMLIHLEDG